MLGTTTVRWYGASVVVTGTVGVFRVEPPV